MRLRYDKSIPADPDPVILLDAKDHRVEMHIRRDPDDTATLVAVSGRDEGAAPDKTLQQGPYQLYDQAVAARRAIAAQLKDAGYRHSENAHPLWTMAVQRSINAARKRRAESEVDYSFDPKDVFLDW